MATILDPGFAKEDGKTPERESMNGRRLGPNLELHKAVFQGDLSRVETLLSAKLDPGVQDQYGNTPLHIAVMFGHRAIIDELLKHGALVKEKNNLGWTPLDEAISYGNKATIAVLLKQLRDQMTKALIRRRQELIKALKNLEDFYAELKWEFQTWVPLLSRLLPSDVCRIYKTGSCIRLDSTLGDFTEMRWARGDLSFIFNGEDDHTAHSLSMVVLDNQTKEYQRMKLLGSALIYANMSTQPITVTRAQSGWFFRVDKTERVGEYSTDVYNITNLILIARRRREHLSPEQIQQHEEMARKVEKGELHEGDLLQEEEEEEEEEDEEEMSSLSPPPRPDVTWEEYISAPVGEPRRLGRPMDLKIERRHYRASVCMAEECPIEMKKLLDILEEIVPYKHFHKLRQFVNLKLPQGFPVKLDVPVFPTVTAVVTLQKYTLKEHSIGTFLIPRGYTKFAPKEKGQKGEKGQNGSSASNSTGASST